jgi:colanic acid biosynthesis glycosyl transferase WcaI
VANTAIARELASYGGVTSYRDVRSRVLRSVLTLKIVVHDFAGHPGQLQLSRELARRGHTVEHQFCQSVTTGQGATTRRESDPELFSVKGITLGGEFARYSPFRRILQEIRYGWLAIRATLLMQPDVAIFSNFPIIPLSMVSLALKVRRIPYIFWWQDVHSEAVRIIARQRLGWVGGRIAWPVDRMERGIANRAAAIVPISHAFIDRLKTWGIGQGKVSVIPNWGALDEVCPRPRANSWSAAHALDDVMVVMYAGTLGLKHDPLVIAELARNAPNDCRIVVVSQGKGRKWLEEHCSDNTQLILLDYQPYEQLANMLASADVLLAILEQDASRYSVPSKVLNYLCAGRPVLALLPSDNPVAHMLKSAEAGIVAPPGDHGEAAATLNHLLSDVHLRERMAANARRYAEQVFDLRTIGDSFERVIHSAVDRHELRHSRTSSRRNATRLDIA